MNHSLRLMKLRLGKQRRSTIQINVKLLTSLHSFVQNIELICAVGDDCIEFCDELLVIIIILRLLGKGISKFSMESRNCVALSLSTLSRMSSKAVRGTKLTLLKTLAPSEEVLSTEVELFFAKVGRVPTVTTLELLDIQGVTEIPEELTVVPNDEDILCCRHKDLRRSAVTLFIFGLTSMSGDRSSDSRLTIKTLDC
ncbi:hypothetical protein GQX74_002761 [Glossina fuscipes]|nr:hypothetical protein GQX74_002761 [Glossina fuscipes]